MPSLNPAYIYFNGHWIIDGNIDQKIFSTGITIYEVIRVINGIPLFNKDHLNRLDLSARLINFEVWLSKQELKEIIFKLITKNNTSEGNIQLQLNRNSNTRNISCRFIPAHYLSKDEYLHGVKTILFKAVRDNPSVKKTDHILRNAANEAIRINNVYEALLIDDDNFISEGSRSNVFFIKDQTIFTSPNEQVLSGVTRQKIFELCKSNGVNLIEKELSVEELKYFNAAFLTGTSPKVLPINQIDHFKFDPDNTILKELMLLYDEEIKNYIQSMKFKN